MTTSTTEYTSSTTKTDSKKTYIMGLFKDYPTAERAINDLKQNGFTPNQIGIILRDRTSSGQLIKENETSKTEAAEGATAGAVGAGILGGLAGWMIGIGALAIPGVGPVVAGGVLASTLGIAGGTAAVGAGIGAATGGIGGSLIGLGIPEKHAKYFEQGVHEGHVLVTVHASDLTNAANILKSYGADTGDAPRARGDVGAMTAGAVAGAVAGGIVGGPVGALAGEAIGGAAGAAAGAAMKKK